MAIQNPAIPGEQPMSPFHNLDHYLAIPRVAGLALSPDGRRLVTTVSTLNSKGTEFGTALWELDPTGEQQARRITRSAKGEAGAVFAANGDVYFTSARPDPESPDGDPVKALWLLPAGGGEARIILSRTGGVDQVLAARDADTTIVIAEVLAGSTNEDDDAERRKGRKDNKVAAILHSGYPVRFWDADLGPGQPRIFAVEEGREQEAGKPATVDAAPPRVLRNLTPQAGPGLREAETVVSPDGRTVYTSYVKPLAKGESRSVLVAVDVETGSQKVLLDQDGMSYFPGPVSPDGNTLVVVSESDTTPHQAPQIKLNLLDVSDRLDSSEGATGAGRLAALVHDWDRWARPAAWLPDGSALLVTADDDGAAPVFRISIPASAAEVSVTRVTQDAAAYTDVVVSPEGRTAYALRSSYAFPPEAARIDLESGEAMRLPAPAERPAVPGRLERLAATAADGARVPAYLALPEGASADAPAPLLLWIHGGPLASWNAWTWRWNPWLLTAKGYAVLLPDPALSTGYGQSYIQRGWGEWGKAPFTDLMAATDAAEKRPDIDSTRTAAMGGSFGGYMANWAAGHTDRFSAIVTHASLWALDQFGPTTDDSSYWLKEMTEEMAVENSPHLHVEKISTPMLVIHGDKDYRVPIGEGLRLWYELLSKSQLAADRDGRTPHRFLYFPDENHWILQPQHAKVWYGVVESFLAKHVLDQDVPVPAELGL
ncbi:prolyl oligopeptidase family serine peptidase [Pseudarthrobacter sp. J75]|uniref:prolyl oligopeptidase family serine peptidase n=1 Tax=unclassified Pseudarthrobacter TaxID=2647000 RepID=UPI002E7FD460|nr:MULTISPECIES: prolyl oligopeptidase family serine peptidase [unclassified Pseudarthrobacter]MEE2521992.1 prolyl oligopeptidase family serine peptidase [Pseudarthrobacter sp. J47]MEE2528917.1 prolyl oligopeptidase family serine peptidase [Pseudarthrobacter sp. J75]